MAVIRPARFGDLTLAFTGWRMAYEVCLVLVTTAGAAIPAAAADVYPFVSWVVVVATPVLLLLRLRWPAAAYVGAALVGLGTGGENTLVLAVLSASFAYRAARGWQLAGGLAVAWLCFVGSDWWWEERPDAQSVVLLSAFFVFIAILPATIARLVRRRRTLLAAMHRRNEQLHSRQSYIAQQAQARERTRIARDLHDSLGHKLTLITLYSGMMRAAEEDRRDETAELLRATSAAAMAELRQILGILRHDDAQPAVRPLTGLDDLAESARASGAEVGVVREGEPRPLSALTEHAAYRVLQEGVTNALRHAHGAPIVVTLRYEPDALVASVTNSAGQQAIRNTSGQGLLGLAERVRVADGMLYHGATPDGGFRLAATLPYQRPDAVSEAAVGEPGPMPPPAANADFADVMNSQLRSSRRILVATTLAIGGVLLLCGAGAWLTTTFATVSRETYDEVHVGQSEREVRSLLPDEDSGVRGASGGRSVTGAACVDYRASIQDQLDAHSDLDLLYRFCYRGGKLVDKQHFLDVRS